MRKQINKLYLGILFLLQEIKDKKFIHNGAKIKITSDFFSGNRQIGREWSEIFKSWEEKNHQPRVLYPEKLSFKSEGEIKNFLEQTKIEGLHCQ